MRGFIDSVLLRVDLKMIDLGKQPPEDIGRVLGKICRKFPVATFSVSRSHTYVDVYIPDDIEPIVIKELSKTINEFAEKTLVESP